MFGAANEVGDHKPDIAAQGRSLNAGDDAVLACPAFWSVGGREEAADFFLAFSGPTDSCILTPGLSDLVQHGR